MRRKSAANNPYAPPDQAVRPAGSVEFPAGQLAAPADAELAVDVRKMGLHGVDRQVQLAADLLSPHPGSWPTPCTRQRSLPAEPAVRARVLATVRYHFAEVA
jgi:hypothetical protein